MKRIVLRGPALTQSGYGVHCRQIAAWLLSKQNIDVRFQALPWGDTHWILDDNAYDGLIGKITKKTIDIHVKPEDKYDVSFQLQLPNEWDTSIAKYNIGMSAVVETDLCNPEWIECCNKMDLVIVPSTHALSALNKSGKLTTQVVVVPESFCDEMLQEQSQKDMPEFSTNFNFLLFGQITGDNPLNDRKNIFFTIKWLCEVFKNDKDVGIVIKTNIGRNNMIDRQKTIQLMKMLVSECRKGDFPKIHLIHGEMSDKDIAALYKHKQIKALVSLTRGEGYGLPILDAAASELPVIVTDWSGHLDFLKHGKFINITYVLKEIHSSRIDNKLFMKGFKWADVNEEDFKKKIVKFRNSHLVPKDWAKELAVVIKEKYSFNAICQYYNEVTKDIL